MGPLVIKERFRESGVTAAGLGAVTCHHTANPPHVAQEGLGTGQGVAEV